MKKIEQAKALATLAEYSEQLEGKPLVVTKRGRPVAVLVPIKGMDFESLSLGTNPDFLAIIERSRASQEKEGGISLEDIRKEFGLPEKAPESPKKTRKKAVV